ncbi:MAG: MFS transporter [Proteobacteria bacterium]|nr:MFS transporter [Pseudomonadota bacterium]
MPVASIETRASWIVASAALVLLCLSFGGPWITAVALKEIAAEFGDARSVPALAGSLAWLGSGLGGIAMGRVADRFGVRWTIMFGGAMIALGLAISTLGAPWLMYVGHGLFMGLLGNAGFNAPLYVYVSRWFDRRRGSALALISSGSYLAGALWPVVFERAIANFGWRQTMIAYGLFALCAIWPIAIVFLKPPPEIPTPAPGEGADGGKPRVLGWSPNAVHAMLATASFMCCVPMAMPQGHLVALCTDLGISATHGAAMLSLLLGAGFVSRQFWGWISDRVGGLLTVLVSSSLQASAMSAYLFTQDEVGLFTVSGAFGVGFSAIIPAYVLSIRALFPVGEANWRVPTLLFMSASGMATGGWLAGALYDYFGFYTPAFAAGVAFNIVNLALVGTLVARQRYHAAATRDV